MQTMGVGWTVSEQIEEGVHRRKEREDIRMEYDNYRFFRRACGRIGKNEND